MPLHAARRLRTSFKAVFAGEAENRQFVDVFLVVAAFALAAYLLYLLYFNK